MRPPAAHSLILPVCVCEQCVCPERFRWCLGTGCADKSERLSHSNGTTGCFVPPASSWRAAVCGDVPPSVWCEVMRARSHPGGSSWMCHQGWGHESCEAYSDFFIFFFFTPKGLRKYFSESHSVHAGFTACSQSVLLGFFAKWFFEGSTKRTWNRNECDCEWKHCELPKEMDNTLSYNPALLFSFRRTHIVRWLFFILDCSGDDSHLLINFGKTLGM